MLGNLADGVATVEREDDLRCRTVEHLVHLSVTSTL